MKIKSLFIGALAAMACIAFAGCGKEEGDAGISAAGEVSGAIVNQNSNVDSVRVCIESDYNQRIIEVGKAKISNNVLSLKLDQTLPDSYLESVYKEFESYNGSDNNYEKYTISDSTAKIIDELFIDAYFHGGQVGAFYRSNSSVAYSDMDGDLLPPKGIAVGYYVYSNKAVVVKGSSFYAGDKDGYDETDIYNIELNKGWNEIVYKVTSSNSSTNQCSVEVTANSEPAGMKWVYVPDESEKSYGVAGKSKMEQIFLSIGRMSPSIRSSIRKPM